MRGRLLLLISLLTLIPLTLWTVSAAPSEQSCGASVRHTVQRGENLFRISLRYGTTMGAIASANGIGDYDVLYAGQNLVIPCPGSAPAYYPPAYATPTYDGSFPPPVAVTPGITFQPITVDCAPLRLTSPDGLNFGPTTFYWNPVSGATSYRVSVYSVDANPGRRVGSWDAPSTRSSLIGDTGLPAGIGFRFQVEVQALVSDIVVCTAPRVIMWRAAAEFGAEG